LVEEVDGRERLGLDEHERADDRVAACGIGVWSRAPPEPVHQGKDRQQVPQRPQDDVRPSIWALRKTIWCLDPWAEPSEVEPGLRERNHLAHRRASRQAHVVVADQDVVDWALFRAPTGA